MRDPVLYPFYADVSSLPGVGAKMKPLLARLIGGETVLDLIFHLPTSWIDRRNRAAIADAPFGEVSTVTGQVDDFQRAQGKFPARIRLRDETGFLTLVYFRANAQWLERTFKIGSTFRVSGEVTQYYGGRQMMHPDYVSLAESAELPPEVEPVYPMTAGLPAKTLRKAIIAALDTLPDLAEWTDPHLLAKKKWPAFKGALRTLHAPDAYDLDAFTLARERLAYDEALAREIAIGQGRQARQRLAARPIPQNIGVERSLVEALGFKPTAGQMTAYRDIVTDLERRTPMRRLIQGDVGSGKTLVAALAAAQVAASGLLTAIMSPTEVLARQQADTFGTLLQPIGMQTCALTSRDRGAAREALLRDIASGAVQLVSGTQTLYQSDVDLSRLSLVVIDEQHRFGVADRFRLTAKGDSPHMLVMSATPIPRTLAHALHGDMDVSTIRDKPAGRQDIATAAVAEAKTEEAMEAVARAVRRGERAFWITPSIDSEDAGDGSAVARSEVLAAVTRTHVEMVHGRLSASERDTALDRFRSGASRILVATTVIEVGIDVPEATIMVIERAERFGLAQLHQLRGRVGRGDKPSSCLLIYRPPLTDAARERLDILRSTNDGFEIAEADFRLRGAGDLLGSRQSGSPDFRVLDLPGQSALMDVARTDAKALLAGDPVLGSDRGRAARHVRNLLAPRLSSLIGE